MESGVALNYWSKSMKPMNAVSQLFAALALGVSSFGVSAAAVDPALPDYKAAQGVSGNISSIGSDTLNNLMTLWAEQFRKTYPNVNIQIQGAGSSTAPPALTEGTANFGPMSRLMKEQEVQGFEKKYGYKPTPVGVAIDALAVFVNKDNPIKGLTIAQVDAAFSATRRCGASQDAKRWSDFGITATWGSRALQLYGRNSASGTYGFFKEKALCKGDFKNNVNEQPGSASVVQSVASGLNAIGYSGIGYKTAGVRALPLAKNDKSPFIEASEENAISGKYPLARILYVYVNKAPNKPIGKIEMEFLKMVLSKSGQQIVIKDGYIAMPAKLAQQELAKLN